MHAPINKRQMNAIQHKVTAFSAYQSPLGPTLRYSTNMHIDLVELNITQKSFAKSSHSLNIQRIALYTAIYMHFFHICACHTGCYVTRHRGSNTIFTVLVFRKLSYAFCCHGRRFCTSCLFQMMLQPKVQADGRPLRASAKKDNIYEAVTRYRVLADNGSAALVQCTPESGLYRGFVRCNSFCK